MRLPQMLQISPLVLLLLLLVMLTLLLLVVLLRLRLLLVLLMLLWQQPDVDGIVHCEGQQLHSWWALLMPVTLLQHRLLLLFMVGRTVCWAA